MDEKLIVRVNKVHSDLMTIIQNFQPRFKEPYIFDNIYTAVLGKMKAEDEALLNEIYPEISIEPVGEGFNIQIIYQRIH